jgi:hypothetical protein
MKEVSCSKNRNFRNTSLQTNEFSKFSRALKSTAAHRRTVKSSEEQWRALGALHSVPPAWTPHRQTNWLAHRQGTARCLQSVRTAVAVQVVLPYKSIRVWSSVIRKIHGDFGPCQTRFASELGVHDIPWYSMIFHDIPWSHVIFCWVWCFCDPCAFPSFSASTELVLVRAMCHTAVRAAHDLISPGRSLAWNRHTSSSSSRRHPLVPQYLSLSIPSGYLTVRHGKSPFLMGKPSINGPFSMAMLNNQWVSWQFLKYPQPISALVGSLLLPIIPQRSHNESQRHVPLRSARNCYLGTRGSTV